MKKLLKKVSLRKNFKRNIALVSMLLFTASLFNDGYCTTLGNCSSGLGLLITGWTALYMGGPVLTWLANPFILIAWLTVERYAYVSLAFSFAGFFTALSFLFFINIYNPMAEIMDTVNHYKSGYWLWLASSFIMLIGNIIILINNKRALNYAT